MTNGEAAAINDRLDRHDEKLGKVLDAVTTQVAICKPTRARLTEVCETTYAKNGTLDRLARLETVREIRGKGFWALVMFVSAIVSGSILALGGTALAWLKG